MDQLVRKVAQRHIEALFGDIQKSILVWLGGMDNLRKKLGPGGGFTFLPHGVGIRTTKKVQPGGNYVEIMKGPSQGFSAVFLNNSIQRNEPQGTYEVVRDPVKEYHGLTGEDLARAFTRQTGIQI